MTFEVTPGILFLVLVLFIIIVIIIILLGSKYCFWSATAYRNTSSILISLILLILLYSPGDIHT
jgi:hypothetical protein